MHKFLENDLSIEVENKMFQAENLMFKDAIKAEELFLNVIELSNGLKELTMSSSIQFKALVNISVMKISSGKDFILSLDSLIQKLSIVSK